VQPTNGYEIVRDSIADEWDQSSCNNNLGNTSNYTTVVPDPNAGSVVLTAVANAPRRADCKMIAHLIYRERKTD
jgi:hypothetical protein